MESTVLESVAAFPVCRLPHVAALHEALELLKSGGEGAAVRIAIPAGIRGAYLQRRAHAYASQDGLHVQTRTRENWLYLRLSRQA